MNMEDNTKTTERPMSMHELCGIKMPDVNIHCPDQSGSDLCTKCPECGFDHTIESCDDSVAEGYRACANPECHQEWYVDIDYNQNDG